MLKIENVADFFIKYFIDKKEKNDLTNEKLNFLLFCAYGIYLARTGKELFKANFYNVEFDNV